MGSLSNLYISQSYQSLIHLGTNNTASAALIELQDGLGNSIGVAVNTSGDLFLSGSLTASLQQGYVLVGNASGRTTLVATSSFGGGSSIDTGSLVTTSSFNSYTQSTNIRLNNLETTSASVNVSISNLNSTTASQGVSITNLNSATASLFTSASLGLTTASVSLNTITFTKGDGTTFPITVNTGSGGGTTNTGSLLVTASAFINTITFTKGDGTTFPVTVTTGSLNYVTGSFGAFYDTTTQSGSAGVAYSMKLNSTDISDGVIISGSGGIKVLAAGTYDLQFSAQVLADTGADTVWIWLKKNGTNVADTSTKLVLRNNEADVAAWNFVVAANANDVFELAWQSNGGHTKLFAEAAASNYTAIPSVIATMNRVDVGGGTNLVSTSSFNSYTSSNDQKVNSLIAATGSYATTGSNTFTGDQTLIDNAGNFYTISDASGSMMLVAKGFTSASAHISASSAGIGNFIFKTNSNTADTIISGSNNIFTNQTAPTAGFKRYIGGSNNIINSTSGPQISGSMAFSPGLNANYYVGTMNMRGPVSSSAWSINNNIIQGTANIGSTAANNAEKAVAGFSMTGNSVNGTLSFVANRSTHTQTNQIQNNIIIGSTTTLTAASSSILYTNNIGGITVTNNASGSGAAVTNSANATYVSQNLFLGSTLTITATGSSDPGDTTGTAFVRESVGNQILGYLNGVNLPYVSTGSNALNATMIAGYGLGVTGSNSSFFSTLTDKLGGSAFFGRYNAQDGNRAQSAQTVFAIGTGTPTTRKTGFLIDSGSNSFFEGAVSISGSLLVNGIAVATGSFATTGSNTFTGVNTFNQRISVEGINILSGSSDTVYIGNRTSFNPATTGVPSEFSHTVMGINALLNFQLGDRNTVIGRSALQNMTTGSNNLAFGAFAGESFISGSGNFFVGTGAGSGVQYGTDNFFLGTAAGNQFRSGSSNIFLGQATGTQFVTGSGNLFIGRYGAKVANNVNDQFSVTYGDLQISQKNLFYKSGSESDNLYLYGGLEVQNAITASSGLSVQGDVKLSKGSNKTCDIVSVNGSATISNSLVTANSIILVTTQNGVVSTDEYPAVVNAKGTGTFDIAHSYGGSLDVAYLIINPTT